MSALKESEENDESMSEISENLMSSQTFSLGGGVPEPSMQDPHENMTPNSDQADLLTHVRFIESICSDGPAKAAYVNGSSSPNISDEILLDISKNVPGFLPKSLHTQNSTVPTSVQFEECDPLRKDGEMTIRQMLTAEDVENRGIWGFDEESPDTSLDCYDDDNDLSWNPQKEFMKFLLEDQDRSETEEKMSNPTISHKRRKRKMDMVVMVDPSEDLYTDLNSDSKKNDHLGEDGQIDHAVNKRDPQWKRPKSHSPVSKNTQYSNGTAVAFKNISPKPAKNRKTPKLGVVRHKPTTDSGSEKDQLFFPSNSKVKEKSNSQRHKKNHSYNPDQKPFICKECGMSFFDHNSFLRHITIHKKKRQKVKGVDEPEDEGRDARFQCPQCTFGTNCPNTFVQHAKTHEKDKRYYRCEKCSFVAMNEVELRGHLLSKHRVTDAQYLVMGKPGGFKNQKVNQRGASDGNTTVPFSCKICSFKTRNKNVLRNHYEILHLQVFEEDSEDDLHLSNSSESSDYTSSPTEPPSSLCKLSILGSLSPKKETQQFLSENSRKKAKPSGVSSPIATDKRKGKYVKNNKFSKNDFRLDKTMNTLLSGKRQSQQRSSETDTNQTAFKKRVKSKGLDSDDDLDPEFKQSGKDDLKSPSKCKGELFALNEKNLGRTLKYDGSGGKSQRVSNNDESSQEVRSDSKFKNLTLVKSSLQKSPSNRKLSPPFHNAQSPGIFIDFPKCRQNVKKKKSEVKDEEDFTYDSTHNFHLSEKCDVKDGLFLNSQFVHKRSSPTKRSPCASSGHSEQDMSSLPTFSIKEECVETELFNAASESGSELKNEASRDFEKDLKFCHYCPARFESGISLSNHIRGHLHRVNVNHITQREASAAQKASLNKVPEVRRKMAAGVKTEGHFSDTKQPSRQRLELICPLCRQWFITRTGLSNHVRGHMKKLKATLPANKTPVMALTELMRDKTQFHTKLKTLERKCQASRRLCPFTVSNGLIYSTAKVQHSAQSGKRHAHISEETEDAMKGSPSSDLIGILKKRRAHEEAKAKSAFQTARKTLLVSPIKDRSQALQHCKALPNYISEKNEHGRKVCAHCNVTFPSGVSLSNHLRAYSRRKRNTLTEGTANDCKQRKQRSRSGSKKKNFPLLHTPDEMYRLTCRFCDLVFQGPLSVQEDWVKHLQRHIMNTAVPHTGAGMVEVTCFPEESDTEAQAKSSS